MDKALSLFNDDRHFWLLARLSNSEQAFARLELIEEAMALLLRHPMIARPVEFGRHVLLISH